MPESNEQQKEEQKAPLSDMPSWYVDALMDDARESYLMGERLIESGLLELARGGQGSGGGSGRAVIVKPAK